LSIDDVPKPTRVVSTIPDTSDMVSKYVTEQQFDVTIVSDNSYEVIDESELGQLIGAQITVDNENIAFEIILYGDELTTPRIINNYTMDKLLELGYGLTPGEIEPMPDDRSQDIRGQQDALFPWLARYKIDDQEDHQGISDKRITLKFTPTIPVPYRRIVVRIRNTDSEEDANVINMSVIRTIFLSKEDPNATPPIVGNRAQFGNVDVEVDEQELRRKKLSNFNYDFNPEQISYSTSDFAIARGTRMHRKSDEDGEETNK
jgi:hypothetical protein